MGSQIKFNWVARIGGMIVILFVGLAILGIFSFSSLFLFIIMGVILAIIGAIIGGDDMWKCDYCWRKFNNKADCIKHEKDCKSESSRREVNMTTGDSIHKWLNKKNRKEDGVKMERHKKWRTILIGIIIALGIIFFLSIVGNKVIEEAVTNEGAANNNNSQNSNSSTIISNSPIITPDYLECGADNCGINISSESLSNIAPEKTIVWIKYTVTGRNELGLGITAEYNTGTIGSGIIIGKDKNRMWVVTNRHIVDCKYQQDCSQMVNKRISENIKIRTNDGEMHTVSRVLFEPHLDIAILEIQSDIQNKYDKYDVAFIQYESPQIGEEVFAIGFPTANLEGSYTELTTSNGTITKKREIISSEGFAFNVLDSSVNINSGNSGGGLFSKDNKLIGITTWGGASNLFIFGINQGTTINTEYLKNLDKYKFCQPGKYLIEDKCQPYSE